ncbi:bifunctional adenosylcobinamide kinase/adenosylcobinamide-phosphate guanylyltransferase [Anaeromicropila populeti]|uniref:Adenosylcobinamide kinase n=1 Tax=Anaeromicropila populeti TaxID=37658 RepID=A0A1I6J0Z2_9FIRM|nr:bifunctional adenosylcobinamide kinase/adenosylcobinamide-phosphate guanylyltransferase [Anaeromicropila populeti]SFR72613.1 adenosylcobinamide kinase /adenosylcobinamide-phosphate guanylyltransferase [Anaeromicropila populeti]
MLTVVIGGSGSGKSEFAENLAVKKGKEKKLIYIATMQPFDKETEIRIKKHQDMRKEKKFHTIECFTRLESVSLPPLSVVLLECMSNLIANEMFGEEGAKINTLSAVKAGLNSILEQSEEVVVVTNNVFEEGTNVDQMTERYIRVLAEINGWLCKQADVAVEVIHGIPVWIKQGGTKQNESAGK